MPAFESMFQCSHFPPLSPANQPEPTTNMSIAGHVFNILKRTFYRAAQASITLNEHVIALVEHAAALIEYVTALIEYVTALIEHVNALVEYVIALNSPIQQHNVRDHRVGTSFKNTRKSGFACITLLSCAARLSITPAAQELREAASIMAGVVDVA